jgi:hypothetical protein
MKKWLCSLAVLALLLGLAGQAGATVIVGNTIYDAAVLDAASGSQYGSWCASTGAAHAAGAGNNLIFNSLSPGTSFSSLRVYHPSAPLTYTYGGSGGGINMDTYFTGDGASPLTPAGQGWRTTWNIAPEHIGVIQDVLTVPPPAGANSNNSAIYHTVLITNNDTSAWTAIGWRNLYDWTVESGALWDDGPNNRLEMANGVVVVPATTFEFAHSPVTADIARVSVDPGVATYQPLLGLAFDPGFRPDLPVTVPQEYDYASWPASVGTAFDYVTTGLNVTGDSAGLSWWGRFSGSAIEIGPGQSVRFTQVLFGVLPDEPPPNVIPEPVTSTLCLMGLGALALRRRKRS